MARKKPKQPSPQSSFFGMMDRSVMEYRESAIPKPRESAVAEEYLTFPKIVRGSFFCPDCKSKVILRPDGSAVCPKCVEKVPCN